MERRRNPRGGGSKLAALAVDHDTFVCIEATLHGFGLCGTEPGQNAGISLRDVDLSNRPASAANRALQIRAALRRHLDELGIGLVGRPLLNELFGVLVRMILCRTIREHEALAVLREDVELLRLRVV